MRNGSTIAALLLTMVVGCGGRSELEAPPPWVAPEPSIPHPCTWQAGEVSLLTPADEPAWLGDAAGGARPVFVWSTGGFQSPVIANIQRVGPLGEVVAPPRRFDTVQVGDEHAPTASLAIDGSQPAVLFCNEPSGCELARLDTDLAPSADPPVHIAGETGWSLRDRGDGYDFLRYEPAPSGPVSLLALHADGSTATSILVGTDRRTLRRSNPDGSFVFVWITESRSSDELYFGTSLISPEGRLAGLPHFVSRGDNQWGDALRPTGTFELARTPLGALVVWPRMTSPMWSIRVVPVDASATPTHSSRDIGVETLPTLVRLGASYAFGDVLLTWATGASLPLTELGFMPLDPATGEPRASAVQVTVPPVERLVAIPTDRGVLVVFESLVMGVSRRIYALPITCIQ